jgi:predicted nucleic-acid-binding protein
MDHDDPSKHRVLTLLNALKEASKDLQIKTNPLAFLFKTDSKSAIEALLELESKAIAIFSTHPNLHNLSHSLTTLKTLIENLENCKGYGLKSIFQRQVTAYKISQASSTLESEIQTYLDRVIVINLVKTLQEHHQNEDEQVKVIVEFEQRLSKGFDLEFQDLILRAKLFTLLERMLIEPFSSKRVKEESAMAIAELVKFNKNVFVGLVLMGPTIKALITMASECSIKVLSLLVRFIRSPLVDEIFSNGMIPTIVGFLLSSDLCLCVAALDCVLELGYIGRKEVVEALLQQELIKILMDLQRREGLCDVEEIREKGVDFDFDDCVFDGCVSKFAIQLEVGEGLSSEEKREVKLEILRLVKEASRSDAEFATISAEILWGSSP